MRKIRNIKHITIFSILTLAFFGGVFAFSGEVFAAAGINKQINFQGKVVNSNGTNVSNGSYDFTFKLYSVSSGGAAIWTETWNTGTTQVTVTDGVFQVALGTHTSLPGSVDFNTDNIYLGIEFNSDGEMLPRVRFTAVPYAFNADKIHGLSVTDTTGTLTIPNAKTISFADAFTTSGANPLTLTTTGSTNVTLPTTGTLATLAGTEEFTNKTIGSTGLTFSGAATDITTASGESLVIVAAGAGTIDIQDATTVDSLTADTGGVSIAAGQSYTGAGAVTLSSGGSSGLTIDSASGRVSVATGDFLSVIVSGVTGAAAGDIWYDSAANKFKINENGSTKILCNTTDGGCGGAGSLTVRETDTSPSVSSVSTLEFGPTGDSTADFVVTDQTGGVARVVLGSNVAHINAAETVSGGWTFNTAATTFTTAINANGGLTTSTTDTNLAFSANGGGDFVFNVDSGTFVSITGTADGQAALTVAAGDVTLSDGDFAVSGGDANITLDAADTMNITKSAADAGDVANIAASSVNAIDGLQVDITSTADAGADAVDGLEITWTESTDADVWTAINIANTTSTNSTTQGLVIGTGYDTGISVASGGITATGSVVFTNTGAGVSLQVNDESADTTPFVVDASGNVGIGTSSPARVLDIVQAASAPQVRLSKDITNYSEFTVDSVGDLQIAATGTDIKALSENLWVCDNDACPALTLTGDGNIFIENVLKFGNGVYLKNDSATELGVYDNDDNAMLVFDEL